MRLTNSLVHVMSALLENPRGKHWGYNLAQKSGVPTGVLYPILSRMIDEGWATAEWENPAEIDTSPRRYYTLTDHGLTEMVGLLRRASTDARFTALSLADHPALQGGA